MAFVSSASVVKANSAVRGAVCSGFAGQRVAGASTAPATVTMRLGTVLGNSSLDKLGLDKFEAERFDINGPMNKDDPTSYNITVQAIYRFVFGNAYIMESERAELDYAESQFRLGNYSVKEFIRALGKTEQYKSRFFTNRPLYGAIEMNYKHFLGRTPDGLEEYRVRSTTYDSQGYDAFVDSFFDDGEYDEAFGEWNVPFYRGFKTEANLSMAAFTHLFKVVRGSSTSDKGSVNAKIPLNRLGISKTPLNVRAPGTPVFLETPAYPGSQGNASGSAPPSKHGVRSGRFFRLEVTGFRQNTAVNGRPGVAVGPVYRRSNTYSSFARVNRAFVVSEKDLSRKLQEIVKNGGKVASVTPV